MNKLINTVALATALTVANVAVHAADVKNEPTTAESHYVVDELASQRTGRTEVSRVDTGDVQCCVAVLPVVGLSYIARLLIIL